MTTRICIIRHGETDWNKEKRIQGQIDIELNETGRAQALAMAFNAAHFTFDAIYSSDLSRARQTAHALAERLSCEVKQLSELRERHYGIFQGVIKDEARALFPEVYAHYKARTLDYDFEHGESLRQFAQRTHDVFNEITRRHIGQRIAVVCHAGLLDVLYRSATGRALETERDFAIPNCALNWFHVDTRGWHLDGWDDHHHLSKVIMDAVE